MPRAMDLVGKVFNRWTVLERVGRVGANPAVKWLCRCSCGNTSLVVTRMLVSGGSRSCGCLRTEMTKAAKSNLRHGMRYSSTYSTWSGMKQRCLYPKHKQYAGYGGRGIKVCDRWLVFENFLADMGAKPSGMTLDRHPDPDGNYEPSNCRWATHQQQADGRRRHLEWEGKRLTQWAKETGLSYEKLYSRLRRLGHIYPTEKRLKRRSTE